MAGGEEIPDAGLPEGFRVDFFGIGAPKSATSWMAACLDEHPRLAVAESVEPNFFLQHPRIWDATPDPRFLADPEGYVDEWRHAPDDALLGDFSINLMRDVPTAPRVLASTFPDARLIVMLRDPVARLRSFYRHARRSRPDAPDLPPTFEAALDNDRFVFSSRYHAQLAAWLEHFPRDAFHVVLDLDLHDDPREVVRSTYAFLGVDETVDPPSLHRRVNPATGQRAPFRVGLAAAKALRRLGLGGLVDRAKRLGLHRTLRDLDLSGGRTPDPPDPDIDRRAREMLRPDVERLEELLDRDLAPWKP